ncbi:MAG: hypothetical protein LBK07_06110, partial [Tannerella sp.]|nr:hypothetical protein [Tannerella sp.]
MYASDVAHGIDRIFRHVRRPSGQFRRNIAPVYARCAPVVPAEFRHKNKPTPVHRPLEGWRLVCGLQSAIYGLK